MTSTIRYQPETLFNDTNAFNVSSPYASKGYFFNDRITDSEANVVWPSPTPTTTSWTESTKPTTSWTESTKPTTDWSDT